MFRECDCNNLLSPSRSHSRSFFCFCLISTSIIYKMYFNVNAKNVPRKKGIFHIKTATLETQNSSSAHFWSRCDKVFRNYLVWLLLCFFRKEIPIYEKVSLMMIAFFSCLCFLWVIEWERVPQSQCLIWCNIRAFAYLQDFKLTDKDKQRNEEWQRHEETSFTLTSFISIRSSGKIHSGRDLNVHFVCSYFVFIFSFGWVLNIVYIGRRTHNAMFYMRLQSVCGNLVLCWLFD